MLLDARRLLGGAGDRFDTWSGEPGAAERAAIQLRAIVLAAQRGRRRQRRRQVELRRAVVVRRDDRVVPQRLSNAPARRVRRDGRRETWRQEALERACILAGVVESDDRALREPSRQLVRERAAAGEAIDAVGVVPILLRNLGEESEAEAARRGEGEDVTDLGTQHRRGAAVVAQVRRKIDEVEARGEIRFRGECRAQIGVQPELAD